MLAGTAMTFLFIDGTDVRAAEVRRLLGGLDLQLATLPSGYAAASPDPEQRARDHVVAFHDAAEVAQPCFAEATDLLTMEGRSLRIELDSENDRRFCRYWRETPARLQLCVALRRSTSARSRSAPVEVFAATCDGRIADKPAGPHELGWDCLFVPDGHDRTLAELVVHGTAAGPRAAAYAAMARALALVA
jgi:XTP/dITP diphosphohydrolase